VHRRSFQACLAICLRLGDVRLPLTRSATILYRRNSTEISYAVTIESTSASASAEVVTQRLEQPAVMAQALSAATGNVVRLEEVVTTTAQPVAGVHAPGSAEQGGAGDGEDGGSSSIRLDTSLILILCAVVAAVCSFCLCCVKYRRCQGAAVKGSVTAEEVDNAEGEWIVDIEQWPGRPPQESAERIRQTATIMPAETIEQNADELAATAPGAWADDRFDIIEDDVTAAGENEQDGSRDDEEGTPPPVMPPASAAKLNLPQQEERPRP
jgi:hypothetical protein